MTGRALRWQGQVVSLDLIFRWAARAVEGLGEPLGTGLLPSSDHTACVDALVPDLHLEHDAARAPPRPGLIARRVKAGELVPTSLIGALGLLDHFPGQGLQAGVTGPAGHRTQVRLVLAPLQPLRRGQVAVAAKEQEGRRPSWPSPLAEPLHHGQQLRACETLGLEDGRHQASCAARREVKRPTTSPALIAIVPGLVLWAMAPVLGVIHIEHADLRRLGIRGDTMLQQSPRHAVEVRARDALFTTR